MDELRWALLGLGLLFVAGLAWWELRKPRQAGRPQEPAHDAFSAGAAAAGPLPGDPGLSAPRRTEPRFEAGEPEVPVREGGEVGAPGSRPPVYLVPSHRRAADGEGISIAPEVAVDTPEPAAPGGGEAGEFTVTAAADEPWIGEATLAEAAGAEDGGPRFGEAAPDDDDMTPLHRDGPAQARPPSGLEAEAPRPAHETPASASTAPADAQRPPPEPEWPPEEQRRIVSLRVAPRPPNRFGGRSLRLAFQACGMEYGALDIFHLADENGRVFASAANLMRPGTFRLETMDSQFFHGVHLFSVLPGPLPAGRAVDELVGLARDIAQRVGGMVLDQVGQPLDEERAAALRASAEEAGQGG